jgi:uncharacterized membrane protein YfcA
MELQPLVLLSFSVLCMAALYSTVGHGGGSGYLAVLAIASIAPEQMRPTALLLNVVVSSIATWKFSTTGMFRKDLFVPLIFASIPAAFIGGLVETPTQVYKPIVGIVLLYAAVRLFVPTKGGEQTKKPILGIVLVAGICIGFFSGVIGVGGGIFLSPLVLLFGWTTAKQTAAISAPFILVNSISGLGGIAFENSGLQVDFWFVAPLAIAVVVGGFIGATFGSSRLGHQGLRTALGVVLLIASGKMFLTIQGVSSQETSIAIKSTHE